MSGMERQALRQFIRGMETDSATKTLALEGIACAEGAMVERSHEAWRDIERRFVPNSYAHRLLLRELARHGLKRRLRAFARDIGKVFDPRELVNTFIVSMEQPIRRNEVQEVLTILIDEDVFEVMPDWRLRLRAPHAIS